MGSTLTFSAGPWLWPALAAGAGALAALAWGYHRAAGHPWRWGLAALKALGCAALVLCLLEPTWVRQRARPGANLFAVIADNSQSLQVRDPGATRARGEELRELLDPTRAAWPGALAATFDVRRYVLDARLQASPDFRDLTFKGRASALGHGLRAVSERLSGRPLAGILLFTDGNATDLRGGLPADLARLPPVYPVVIGRPGAVRDLSLAQVGFTQSAFEDAPVDVQAEVVAGGFAGRPVTARLLDRSGKVLQEQTREVRRDGETLAFRFRFKPAEPGLSFHELRVSPPPGEEASEATRVNNQRVITVDRGRGPLRVLYVSGRPNWEYKFLNRAIEGDEQLQLVGLIRVAKREPKFDFRGRAGETSNPLFRGFGNQAPEDVQRYDQPVLVRLNTRDELELRAGFPRTPEELFGYHAVIVDDLEAEFFSADQAALLQRFVSERGGGFLMLGGMESFQEGRYHRTPVGEMLPVYLDRSAGESAGPAKVQFQLSREGWLQPWARLRETEGEERARLETMPPFEVLNRVRALKPGASAIASVRDEKGTELPALAVQRFGRGRTAALMVGDLWRWGMRDAAAQEDMARSWRQLVRWLVADVPGRIQVSAEPVAGDPNGAQRLQVRVRDEKFQPVDDAVVSLEVEPVLLAGASSPPGPPLRLAAEPAAAEPGLHEASYVPRQTGGFRAVATVRGADGSDLGRAETGWSSDLAAEEFRLLQPNVALLEELARRTGGRAVLADELDDFVRRLPELRAPVMETWTQPAWHSPFFFAFALACLLAEWGLRRWKGLP